MITAPAERIATLPEGVPELTLGWEAIKWATKYLKQPDGDHAGDRWHFIESQVRFLLWYYSLDETGKWLYTHGVRRLPKGAGKSPFAAVLALIELLAPVRFASWAVNVPGGCSGKRVSMPLVQIAATAESQGIVNTMRMVRALVPPKSRLVSDYAMDVGKTIIYIPGGGQLHIITNSATAEEGALTTFAVMDQTESWYKMNGGHDLFQVIDRNLAKRGNRGIETANAWKPDMDSQAERTFDAWVLEQEGRTRGTARTLMDIRMAPPDTISVEKEDGQDVYDIDALLAGTAFAYGDAYWVDAEDIVMNHILDAKTPLDVAKRFYLNWPTSAEDAWAEPKNWARLADPSFAISDGDEITMGFDGSRTRDATALIGCHVETGFTFELGLWETAYSGEGMFQEIPVDEVDAAISRAFDRWNVVAFFADVREWESFTKVEWPKHYADQLKVWSVPGGRDPQPIAWDMRGHTGEFTGACELVLQEIEDQQGYAFRHDGSSALGRHVANARRRPNRWGISIGKESGDSSKKIDGCVAMIIARHARRIYLASQIEKPPDEKKKPKASRVWSFS